MLCLCMGTTFPENEGAGTVNEVRNITLCQLNYCLNEF